MNNSPRLTMRAIHVRGLNLQLARPVETASGVLSTAPLVLIDLVTDEGIIGSSYIRCYTPLALQPLAQLVANCGEPLTGQAAAPATIEQKLQQHFRLLGVTPTGQRLEYLDIGSNILMEPLHIQDGYAVMLNRPRSGLAWNEEAVKRWLVYEAPSP